ncbi:MAG TPA: nucleoside triphosphate pyrophosphohydrolase [Mycobacteriales bacterium]|nr:nucleoside triphosphate pyrophosphohydrolase [Mycobacteriales bacterium]
MPPHPAPDRLVVVVTTPRVAPGLLSAEAWELLRAGPVLTARADHPQLPALAAAGVPVSVVDESDPASQARAARERARATGRAVWLADPGGDDAFGRALGALALHEAAAAGPGVEVEIVHASYDLPGARLLDVVATMDRLRSPGGCPWDAKQTHATLARYLLEEAYEAYEAIETAQTESYDDLREELGDVLLQVVFHARVAEERGAQGWTIDDVARRLVDKLVRRHPHVFGDVRVSGADEVVTNWEAIKETEKRGRSVTEGVPLSQPALALAAALQKRAAAVGAPVELLVPEAAAAETLSGAVAAAAARVAETGADADEPVGELLFAAVALARSYAVDPEAALRRTARRFRHRLAAVEAELRADGRTPSDLGPADWRERWSAAGSTPEPDEPAEPEE